jgi:hypothetical protein
MHNDAVAFKGTFRRRCIFAAAFALCAAVVVGCTKPPPMVNAKLTFPPVQTASPAAHTTSPAAPSPSSSPATSPSSNPNHFAASFRPDPGFVLGLGGAPNNVTFECCLGRDWSSSAADRQPWAPGEQVLITWVEGARPAPGSAEDTMFLSANMSGPWPTVADVVKLYEPDTDQVAKASVVRWSTDSAGSATSVITIPAHARPGYYDIQFSAAAQAVGGCGTSACAPGFYDAAIIKVT